MTYEQDPTQPTRHFVGLRANIHLAPWGTVQGVALGQPLLEPEGVPDRRFAFSHRWNQADIDDLNTRGAPYGMAVVDAKPGDWREEEAVL